MSWSTGSGKTIDISYDSDLGSISYEYIGGGYHVFKASPKTKSKFTGWDLNESYSGNSGYWYNNSSTSYVTVKSGSKLSDRFVVSDDVSTNVSNSANFSLLPRIEYDLNGGSHGSSSTIASTYGEGPNVKITTTIPTLQGYDFDGWDIGGVIYGSGATYNLTGNVTAVAQWKTHQYTHAISASSSYPAKPSSLNESDAYQSAPPTVTISSNSAISGTSITATAQTTGLTGIVFIAWNVSGVGGIDEADRKNSVLTFTMPDNDVTLTATYGLKPINVTHGIDDASKVAVAQGANTSMTDGTDSAIENPVYGDIVTFVAPEPISGNGCSFDGWYENGTKVSDSRTGYARKLLADLSLVAKYKATVTIRKNTEYGNGDAYPSDYPSSDYSVSREYVLGSQITIVADASAQSFFGGWYVDGEENDYYESSQLVTVDRSHDYLAVFTDQTTFVAVRLLSEKNDPDESGSPGTLSISGTGVSSGTGELYRVVASTNVVLTATPALGPGALQFFRLVEVLQNGDEKILVTEPSGASYTRKLNVGRHDRVFKARWGTASEFTTSVSVREEDSDKGIVYIGDSRTTTSVTNAQDDSVTVYAVSFNGYRFVGWYEDGEIVEGANATYMVCAQRDRALVAHFEEDMFAICLWEGSDENKNMEWTSKTFVMPRPFDPVAARVDAMAYGSDGSLQLSVGTFSSPTAASKSTHKRPVTIWSQDGRRLPRTRPERFVSFTVTASEEVDAILIGTNMAEVN